MLSRLFRRKTHSQARALLEALQGAARDPAFFQPPLNTPDDLDGRYEIVMIHLFLLTQRLSAHKQREQIDQRFAQQIYDQFFQDMDIYLREIGISDARMAKQVQTMAKLFEVRARSLDLISQGHETAEHYVTVNLRQDEQSADISRAARLLEKFLTINHHHLASLESRRLHDADPLFQPLAE